MNCDAVRKHAVTAEKLQEASMRARLTSGGSEALLKHDLFSFNPPPPTTSNHVLDDFFAITESKATLELTCPVCLERAVETRMVQCDACDAWVHYDCDAVMLDDSMVDQLEASEEAYQCPICRLPPKRQMDTGQLHPARRGDLHVLAALAYPVPSPTMICADSPVRIASPPPPPTLTMQQQPPQQQLSKQAPMMQQLPMMQLPPLMRQLPTTQHPLKTQSQPLYRPSIKQRALAKVSSFTTEVIKRSQQRQGVPVPRSLSPLDVLAIGSERHSGSGVGTAGGAVVDHEGRNCFYRSQAFAQPRAWGESVFAAYLLEARYAAQLGEREAIRTNPMFGDMHMQAQFQRFLNYSASQLKAHGVADAAIVAQLREHTALRGTLQAMHQQGRSASEMRAAVIQSACDAHQRTLLIGQPPHLALRSLGPVAPIRNTTANLADVLASLPAGQVVYFPIPMGEEEEALTTASEGAYAYA
jgi:hypothetical protein